MSKINLVKFILSQQNCDNTIAMSLVAILHHLAGATKHIAQKMNKAGLIDVIGSVNEVNVHGEHVQKMDKIAHDTIVSRLPISGVLCAMASEEEEDIITIAPQYQQGEYMLLFDPLDGSSNIDVNISVGTIFSILRKPQGHEGNISVNDMLQSGCKQVAAGYVIYGSSTMLIFSLGQGVHAFTLDTTEDDFILSRSYLTMPKYGKVYSVNEAYLHDWDDLTKQSVDFFKDYVVNFDRQYSARYVGSLVADFHRTLFQGGIYMYPADKKKPNGKLRLMYEASPLAFIAEQAGGKATNGKERILDVQVKSLHQRTPLFIGSEEEIDAITDIFLHS